MDMWRNSEEGRAVVNAVMNVRFASHAGNYQLIGPVTSGPVQMMLAFMESLKPFKDEP
jgi:hypothetical protein